MIEASVLQEAFAKLDTEGYCVIKNVLSLDECASARAGIHAYLLAAGIDLADPTLEPKHWPQQHGIVQDLAVGQCQAVWNVREHERVAHVFAELHGDNDLLVSFDGVCVQPTNVRDTGARLHTDQSHKRLGRLCVQGLINLTPALDEGTGTLMVLPRGHLGHSAFAVAHPDRVDAADWFQYDDEHLPGLVGGAEYVRPVRVFADVGDLVLWDSRTPHRGAPPPKQLPDGVAAARERNVVYVCMEPRVRAPRAAIAKKQRAYADRRMTSHWPAARKLFAAKVSTFRRPHLRVTKVPERDDRTRSARQLELAGMTPLTTRTRALKRPGLKFDF